MRWTLLSVVAFLLSCGPTAGSPVEAVERRSDSILAAATDATSSSVFLLDLRFDNAQTAICSAVQVTPRVLLTAAHCLDLVLHGNATSVIVRATNAPDDSMLTSADFINVTLHAQHPQWNSSASMSPYDLAALLLARAPTNSTPSGLQRTLPPNLAGQSIRLVGYGRTSASASDSGTRRTAMVAVSSVTADVLQFGSAGATGICSGDSGGPSFFRGADQVERVIGIHSLTRSSSCGSGSDIRVDQRLSFIDGFVMANDPPQCTADGRCAPNCTPADPDCPSDCAANGVCATNCASPDPDCQCRADGTCETSCPGGVTDPDCRCGADGQCETSCPPGMTDPDCRCRANGQCEASCPAGVTDPDCDCSSDGVCVANCAQPDPDCADCGANDVCSHASCPTPDTDCLEDGAVCTAAASCIGNQCVADPRGFSFCSRSCTTSETCQLDMQCISGVCRSGQPAEPVKGGCISVDGPSLWAVLVLSLLRRRTPQPR